MMVMHNEIGGLVPETHLKETPPDSNSLKVSASQRKPLNTAFVFLTNRKESAPVTLRSIAKYLPQYDFITFLEEAQMRDTSLKQDMVNALGRNMTFVEVCFGA